MGSHHRDENERRAALMADALRLSLVDGLSLRAIARRLSISRNTVRKLLRAAPPQVLAPQVGSPRGSILEPYRPEIKALLDDVPEMKAPAVLERLRRLGYTGGITVVRDHLRRIRPRPHREAFLTLDFHPGAAMQVDWADFGFAIPGCPRRVSALVMALCYSRLLYIEFCLSQAFGTFVRAMERGLAFFGGTTLVDIFDNMRTVVLVHNHKLTRFNHSFLAYARARNFGIRACTPGKGNEKGRVERPIGFVRERFWPGRRFTSLLDLNRQATEWRDDFANNREHEVTGKIPALVFKYEEKRLLKPLPATPFETDDIISTGVTKTFRVGFDRNLYSVPPRLLGQTVVVRANDDAVAVFLGTKQVALHRRSWGIGEDIEHPSHRSAALETKPGASAGVVPSQLVGLGEVGGEYFKVFAAGRRSIQREITRLTFLCELFSFAATADAMAEVMTTGHVGAEYVEYVLRHKRGLSPAASPLRLGDPELDALNFGDPDLSVYDQIVPTQMTIDPGDPPDQDDDPWTNQTN
ncbi:MAG: IS21 family transposase [Acidobacteriota bacterium]